ncbi:MAG TPA: gamma-glutamyltransferase, partial [Thermoanaerobaculia bacterium]|nr:gamma-glutamyltransferase [Thermoanaerobaculia bacterium]
ASPIATRVGLDVLSRGGNAIDAAVAGSFALAVVHPQAGNLGGGGFLVYYDAKTKGVWTLDFRETAPLAARRDMFAGSDTASRSGPQSIAIPGSVAGIEAMYRRFGTRPWGELMAPAIRLAREGFKVDADLARDLESAKRERNLDPFGKALAAGDTFVQADLAATLDRIALAGAKEFYEGETAKRLVEGLRETGGNFGYRDLRDYQPVWRAPIRIRFGEYDIYTTAPPSAGGLVIGEVLNILSSFPMQSLGFQSPKAVHLLVEAERRAYIDRAKYLGDPGTSRIPYRELLSAERAALWRKSIDPNRVTMTSTLTEPGSVVAEREHTTHFTIVDAQGNVAAITTTLNENFGSGILAPGCGFLLNNSMDDFTAAPGKPNRYGLVQGHANAIDPGKRMASSMAPTIVLKNGAPFLALGTRGGPTIPTTILQIFLGVTVYGKSLADAVAAPRYHHQAMPDTIYFERDRAPKATIDALNAMGHPVAERDPIGDVHAILIDGKRIIAVADPRAGGAAGGI